MKLRKMIVAALPLMAAVGCAQGPMTLEMQQQGLAGRARGVLMTATHDASPLLRSHAIEALADADQSSAVSFVLEGLNDTYWGVRFTACMAVMEMRYPPARERVEKLVTSDPSESVRVAAAGTLHVLGDYRYTSLLGSALFRGDVIVRRNAATVLGRIGQQQACKLLKSAAIRDEDMSVKLQAVESLTLLGDRWAQGLMINNCRSVYDDECILSILALGRANVEAGGETIAYVYDKSKSPDRLGMKLVAARGLAMLKDYRGRNAAVEALSYQSNDSKQAAVIRNLAAMALGEMADKTTLGPLEKALADPDPDVRIAAALAILKTIRANPPF